MKIGLLGDIHGNIDALRAVLQAAKQAEVRRLLLTGDLVGYYFSPLSVINELSSWKCDAVRGNHEEMLSKSRYDNNFLENVNRRYGSGLKVAINQLSTSQQDELCQLPERKEIEINGTRILLCHGSPWNSNEYVYPTANYKSLKRFQTENFDIVVMGHTHYPMIKKIGKTVLVNPGSVGQPRSYKPGAEWALLDSFDQSVVLRREAYDTSKLIQECLTRHPELPYLSNVLMRTE